MKDYYRCKKCKQSLNHHMLIALMIMCGVKSSTQPTECPMGGKHDYEKVE